MRAEFRNAKDNENELKLRLERLESLVLQLDEELAAAKGVQSKSSPAEGGSQSEHVNHHLDRIESLLSQQSAKVNRPERPKVSRTHEKATQTEAATERTDASVWLQFLFMLLLVMGIAVVGSRCKDAEDAEKRRQIIEAVVKRLTADHRVDSRPLRSEKKSSPEDDDDASFENLEY